jgi:ribosomal protein S18 acetylase RimI-like enzyme
LRWVGPAGRIALREFDYASDVDAVCGFQKETYTLNFPNFQYTPNFAAAFRHDLRRASLDGNHALFVLDASRVVGFIWLVICENSWTNERYGYVNNVFVESSQRGGGLGRELMSGGEEWFRQRGIKRARLTVTANNEAACRLYENCGYGVARLELDKDL